MHLFSARQRHSSRHKLYTLNLSYLTDCWRLSIILKLIKAKVAQENTLTPHKDGKDHADYCIQCIVQFQFASIPQRLTGHDYEISEERDGLKQQPSVTLSVIDWRVLSSLCVTLHLGRRDRYVTSSSLDVTLLPVTVALASEEYSPKRFSRSPGKRYASYFELKGHFEYVLHYQINLFVVKNNNYGALKDIESILSFVVNINLEATKKVHMKG